MGSPRANRETVRTLTASAVGVPGRQDFESGAEFECIAGSGILLFHQQGCSDGVASKNSGGSRTNGAGSDGLASRHRKRPAVKTQSGVTNS